MPLFYMRQLRSCLSGLTAAAALGLASHADVVQLPDPGFFVASIEVAEVSAGLPGQVRYPYADARVVLELSSLPGDEVVWYHESLEVTRSTTNPATLILPSFSATDAGNYQAIIHRGDQTYATPIQTLNLASQRIGSAVDPTFALSDYLGFFVHPTFERTDGALATMMSEGIFVNIAWAWVSPDGTSRETFFDTKVLSKSAMMLGAYPDGSYIINASSGCFLYRADGTVVDLTTAQNEFLLGNQPVLSSTGGLLTINNRGVCELDAQGNLVSAHPAADYDVRVLYRLQDADPLDDRAILFAESPASTTGHFVGMVLLLEADGRKVDGFNTITYEGYEPVRLADGSWARVFADTLQHFDVNGTPTTTVQLETPIDNFSIAPDGYIYVADAAGLYRIAPDGSRDPDFMVLPPTPGSIMHPSKAFTADGGLMVHGHFTEVEGHRSQQVFKVQPEHSVQAASPFVAMGSYGNRVWGQSLTLSAMVSGNGPFTYEWLRLDEGPLPDDVHQATLTFPHLRAEHLGVYQLRVTNAYGSALSETMDLRLLHTPQLVNISGRGRVQDERQPLVAGFVLDPRWHDGGNLLLRGVGPTLADFDLSDPLADPRLELVRFGDDFTAFNNDWDWPDNWTQELITAAGAFPLGYRSKDAQLAGPLAHGAYTATLTGPLGDDGLALVEVYALNQGVANLSLRGRVGTGDDVLIGGFTVLDPDQFRRPLRLLLRAVGPGLSAFGVADAIPDPEIVLFDSDGEEITRNQIWTSSEPTTIAAAARSVGAFALDDDAVDAAFLVELPAGHYTAHVLSADGSVGTALLEIYRLP